MTNTLVSGQYICLQVTPFGAGEILKRPPFLSSRIAAKTLGESKCGKQSQSIDPSIPTSATLCMSPMIP